MHEYPVCESILKITLQHAHEARATRVLDIYLVIGELSSMVDDSIQFYWDILSENTIAQGATLHFERIPATFKCTDCGSEFPLKGSRTFQCPHCQSYRVEVLRGEEFYIDAIDVDGIPSRSEHVAENPGR